MANALQLNPMAQAFMPVRSRPITNGDAAIVDSPVGSGPPSDVPRAAKPHRSPPRHGRRHEGSHDGPPGRAHGEGAQGGGGERWGRSRGGSYRGRGSRGGRAGGRGSRGGNGGAVSNKRTNGDSIKRTVYICDIDQQVTEAQLAGIFHDCGLVMDCRVCGDPNR